MKLFGYSLLSSYMIYVLYCKCWYNVLPKLDFTVTLDLVYDRTAMTLLEMMPWIDVNNDYLLSAQHYALRQPYVEANKSYEIVAKDTHFSGVAVRVYIPPAIEDGMDVPNAELRPGILHLHGDRWTSGSIEWYDSFCHRLAHSAHAVVVAVQFRLPPEFPYPAGLEDTVTAYKYFSQHAFKYAVNPDKIIVMGESTGGNLALATALKLRDEGFAPGVRAQVLLHPIVQVVNLHTPAHQLVAQVHGFSRYLHAADICYYLYGQCSPDLITAISKSHHVSPTQRQEWFKTVFNLHDLPVEFRTDYIQPDLTAGNATWWAELREKFADPYVSPLLWKSLKNLPETFLLNVNFGQTRDEVHWFKARLEKSGVSVKYRFMPNGFQGILRDRYLTSVDAALKEFEEIVKFIKKL